MVIPSYTPSMKTAISVPDPIFLQVEQAVKDLGVTRSEFFTRAVQRYMEELKREGLTARINHAVAGATGVGDVDGGATSLDEETREWTDAGVASLARLSTEEAW